MINQKLTDRSILINSAESDLIHIVRNNTSYKQTVSTLVDDKIAALTSGYIGELLISDTPTVDGYYLALEAGTYTNAGSLVVSLDNKITFISVSDTQTTFTKTEIAFNNLAPTTEYTFIFSGQSNMVGAETWMNDGGDRDTDSRVTIWNDVAVAWQVADLANYPFGNLREDGITYCNNLAFHTAKRIAERNNANVRIIFEATGGQSITQWMGTGVASPYWVNILDKISASGASEINGWFWHQGENDGFDNAYSDKLQILIDQFRALPESTLTAAFIAGQLAQGLDINGIPTGAFNGQRYLNSNFYRVYQRFISDDYFSVADGNLLPVVGVESVADGVHFHGTALVSYSYLYADKFEQTPITKVTTDNIIEKYPTTITGFGNLGGDESKYLIMNATAGNVINTLPFPKFGKEIIAKRIDTTEFQCGFNIATGLSINGIVNGTYNLLKQNDLVIFKATSETNYDVFGFLREDSGVTVITNPYQSAGNMKKYIHLDATSNGATIILPPVEYKMDFYIRGINATFGASIVDTAGSDLETGANITVSVGELYYAYSDGTLYYVKKIA
jgi:hypothetical protein